MSFSVNQRTQEFGVRMALGAGRGRILGMVIRQSAIQIAIGAGVGLGLASLIAALGGTGIQSVLFSVNPRDPAIYGTVFGLIVVVSLIATMVPARRATKVDPIVALRSE
jgi:putative ABC transport system permease protein